MTCKRCGGPRPSGRGRRYCGPDCRLVATVEAQERAMDRFKDRNPNYWRDYWRQG